MGINQTKRTEASPTTGLGNGLEAEEGRLLEAEAMEKEKFERCAERDEQTHT